MLIKDSLQTIILNVYVNNHYVRTTDDNQLFLMFLSCLHYYILFCFINLSTNLYCVTAERALLLCS